MILLCADAGLHVWECGALRWSDIDLEAGQLIVRSGDGHRERAIALSRTLLDALRVLPGHGEDPVLGFTTDVRARQRMQQVCKQAGVPYRGLHALRATSGEPQRAGFNHSRITIGAVREMPSYPAFKEELFRVVAQARRTGNSCGLLIIGFDQFVQTSDEHGHEVGEAALAAVAGRIDRGRRPYDFVARIEGEKFAVILVDIASAAVLSAVAHRFSSSIRSYPVGVQGNTIPVSVTIGAAFGPDEPDHLIRVANEHLRRAKEQVRDISASA
jgi:diguanylate cyclase (GGDEF)-like protein